MRRRDDEKEQRMKDAVIEVVLAEGFGGASASKITKCAGIASATLYIYYDSKERMLQSVYKECAEERFDVLLSGVQGETDGKLLKALLQAIFNLC